MSDHALAPYNNDQVGSLNAYQASGTFHEFTCANSHGPLVANNDGWHCDKCNYAQRWSWAWMANWEWQLMAQSVAKFMSGDHSEFE